MEFKVGTLNFLHGCQLKTLYEFKRRAWLPFPSNSELQKLIISFTNFSLRNALIDYRPRPSGLEQLLKGQLDEYVCCLRISLSARVSGESPFTHLIIISEKKGEEKRSEKQCRENLTCFHKTYYLVKDQIIFPEQSFRPHLFP